MAAWPAPAARAASGAVPSTADEHALRVRRDVEEYLRSSGAEDVLSSTMRALEAARPRNAPAFIARFVQDHFAVAVAPSLLGLDPPAHGIPAPDRGDSSDSDASAGGSARYPVPPASFFARGARRRKARRHAVSGPPRPVGFDLDGPALAAAALGRPVGQLGCLLADGAAAADDRLGDALLDLEAGRRAGGRAAVGSSGRGGTGAATAGRPGTPGSALSASVEALAPSGGLRNQASGDLLERALALERAGALSGSEWPFEAAAAASGAALATYAAGETVGAAAAAGGGTPREGRLTLVAVLSGRLERREEPSAGEGAPPTASPSALEAGSCLSIAALCLRPASAGAGEGAVAGAGAGPAKPPAAAPLVESRCLPPLVATEPSRTVEARGDSLGTALGLAWRRRLERRIAVLGAVGLLRKLLQPGEIASLADGCVERRVRPGALAAAQGRPALGPMVVMRGAVALVVDRALAFEGNVGIRPERVRLATLRAGAVVGMDAALRPRGWLADVLAWPEELDAAAEASAGAPSAPRDAITGAVEGGGVPGPIRESQLPVGAGSASLDCILLEIPRAAIEGVCGEPLLVRAQRVAPDLFAEELGRLA